MQALGVLSTPEPEGRAGLRAGPEGALGVGAWSKHRIGREGQGVGVART